MRKNALVLCCVTCVFGAFGAFFRWLQDLTGFEADTGLYISGNIWSTALIIACAACAAVLLVMTQGLRTRSGTVLPEDYAAALGGTTGFYKPGAFVLAGVMAAGSVLLLFSAGGDSYPVFQVVLSVLGLLGAAGFLLMTSATWRKRQPPLNCLGATLLVALFCFWLVVSYRENATSPVVWAYAMEILAVACALLAFYFVAGVPFGRPKPITAIFFCQFAAFLCIVTLPDSRHTGAQIMLIASAGMLLFFSWMMVTNLRPAESAPSSVPEADAAPAAPGPDAQAASGDARP